VDVAVICATNKNLKEMIARGEFREDLYYRLNGLVVRLPALRERQDLEIVTRKILASVCRTATPMAISAEVMDLFHQFPWPGNFRQLFNLLRTTVVMAGDSPEILLHHLPQDFLEEAQLADRMLPPSIVRQMPYPVAAPLARMDPCIETPAPRDAVRAAPLRTEPAKLENVALDAMAQALRSAGGNVSVAAKTLGVSRNTIYRKKSQLPTDVWG
jgi:transcriptional regulator of acetoin/glycerol metabolism